MIVKAPAKINLAIDIGARRNDGYHEVDMVTFPLELHDCLEITELMSGGESYITSDNVLLLCDESNLVTQAFNLLKERYTFKKSFRIEIDKRIPMQAGLAGGSADAAALFRAIIKDRKLNIAGEELTQLALSIGADLPFCLQNIPSRVQGIGEKLTPIKTKLAIGVLLVKPKQGLSTREVYELADTLPPLHADIPALITALESNKPLAEIGGLLKNGLRPAASKLCPEIDIILDKMRSLNFLACEMSGSGSACFALSRDSKQLQHAAKVFQKLGYETIITSFAEPHK